MVKKNTILQKQRFVKINKETVTYMKKMCDMELVTVISAAKNKWCLDVVNLLEAKHFRNEMFVNNRNLQKQRRKHLGDDPYVQLLVSTDKGVMTLSECEKNGKGGILKLKIRAQKKLR